MRYLFTTLAVIFFIAPFGVSAQAADPLSVSFDSTPLFDSTDLLPGAEADSGFTATNNTGDTLDLYIHFIADSQSGGTNGATLADVIDVTVTETGGGVQTRTLSEWFAVDEEVIKTGFGGGDSASFVLDAAFNTSADDDYQNSEVRFDVCIGLSGGDEVCVDDMTPTDPDDDDDTSGGGGGGSTTGGFIPPDGEVEGASTTTEPTFTTQFVTPFLNLGRGTESNAETGEVAGDSATTTAEEEGEDAVGNTQVASVVGAGIDFFDNLDCLFLWLLALVFISLSWSVIEDKLRNTSSAFGALFVRNAIFSGGYVIALAIVYFLGWLDMLWWLFALVWFALTALDYRLHMTTSVEWSARPRNVYYAALAIIFAIIAALTTILCVMWPFLVIMFVSILLFVFDQ